MKHTGARAAAKEKKARGSKRVQEHKLTIFLSEEAKENLELLRLKSLDRRGRKPTGSEIIEDLLLAALEGEKVPYPV
ncbi:MAG TPA: hypothetical protein VNO43_09510 [Candidatus Eisenbacteria bacterium]|nr:hypothetical protein [Candidatus Eisenbacteria bacterium]